MADAAAREVREETGLDVEIGLPLDWVERISPDHHFVILDFAATVTERPATTQSARDGFTLTRSRPSRWVTACSTSSEQTGSWTDDTDHQDR
jgi:ADP-ribose pyrophosphatase YjhB (NUDIX family)